MIIMPCIYVTYWNCGLNRILIPRSEIPDDLMQSAKAFNESPWDDDGMDFVVSLRDLVEKFIPSYKDNLLDALSCGNVLEIAVITSSGIIVTDSILKYKYNDIYEERLGMIADKFLNANNIDESEFIYH